MTLESRIAALVQAIGADIKALQAASGNPVGTIIAFSGSTPPPGYSECNGVAVNRGIYAALFGVIGTIYGAGDGVNTFNLPDLRGEFLRGWDHGRGVDVSRELGTAQTDAMQPITGTAGSTVTYVGKTGSFFQGTGRSGVAGGGLGLSDLCIDSSRQTRTAAETRPRNIAVMYCIKY